MLNTARKGFDGHNTPFYIGDLDPGRPFVHVFDEDSLRTVLTTRDTIIDFVQYLIKRERLFRGLTTVSSTGEEELLAIYLKELNAQGEHDFIFPGVTKAVPNHIYVTEGHWADFQKHPQRQAQLHQDKVSYSWDRLIEKFSHYALRGEQYYVTEGGLADCDRLLTFMAREPRYKRRALSQRLHEMLRTTKRNQQRIVVVPGDSGSPFYVFLLFPLMREVAPYDEYRRVRRELLVRCCAITRLQNPDALDIVGIATESGFAITTRSEDAVYFNGRCWNEKLADSAKTFQAMTGVLTAATQRSIAFNEYPDVPMQALGKNPRNKKCPCGSGQKYKYCCGA